MVLEALFVFVMRPDEKPSDRAVRFDAESTVSIIDPYRPVSADFLEPERRMCVIFHPNAKLLAGALLGFGAKPSEPPPEFRSG